MTKKYDEEMRFVVFPTIEKKSEKAPTHWGSIQINGKKWKLDGWPTRNGGVSGVVSEWEDKAKSEKEVIDNTDMPF